MSFRVYCDGSGTTTGLPAGIAFVAYADGGDWFGEGSLPLRNATNQQAEILAATFALHSLRPLPKVVVITDSKYVVECMTLWLDGWLARGWRTRAGKPVKNQAYWQRLIDAASRHGHVDFEWTRGHVGTQGNERADELAGLARQRALAAINVDDPDNAEWARELRDAEPKDAPSFRELPADALCAHLLATPTIPDTAWVARFGSPARLHGESRAAFVVRVLSRELRDAEPKDGIYTTPAGAPDDERGSA